MTGSTTSLITPANLLTKVYFPRLIIPLAPVLARLVDFGVAFLLLLIIIAWYGIKPTVNVVCLPLLIVLMVCTAAGVGMWLSALALQYRDVKYVMPFVSQILMYAAPVAWPMSPRHSVLGSLPQRLLLPHTRAHLQPPSAPRRAQFRPFPSSVLDLIP